MNAVVEIRREKVLDEEEREGIAPDFGLKDQIGKVIRLQTTGLQLIRSFSASLRIELTPWPLLRASRGWTQPLSTPSPHRIRCRSSLWRIRAVIPSSAESHRRSISRVKCLASWGEWITSRVSSLVCAAVDHGELVMQLVTLCKARRAAPCRCNGFEATLMDAKGFPGSIRQNPGQQGT